MHDYIAWAIIIAILGSAIGYIIMQKRKGVKCIGCPSEAKCSCVPAQELNHRKASNHECPCQHQK